MQQMSVELSHLTALKTRLMNEKARFDNAKTRQEVEMRAAILQGIEKEIRNEIDFLAKKGIIVDVGTRTQDGPVGEMSDEELLKQLEGDE